MKMNAKKLTLALVALLLALTCVFAACKKDEPQPVDDKPAEQPAETLAKEDLVKIAEKFKADFVTNYLNLYTDEVAIQIESEKSEALLKIAAASSKDEAETIAKNFMDALKAKRTLIDDVKDLIAQVADVDLDDEADVKTMNVYNTRLLEQVTGATGNKKTLLDAYKAETAPTVSDISWRLSTLKLAKLCAGDAEHEGTVNYRIAEFLKKTQDAKKAVYDSELEQGVILTFADYEEMLKLEAYITVFTATYELTPGTKAYSQILDKANYDAAVALFNEKTEGNEQIDRAQALYDAAKALAAAAVEFEIPVDDVKETTEVEYISGEEVFNFAQTDGPFYFMLKSVFEAGSEEKTADDQVLVTLGQTNVYVAKSDVYTFLPTAWAELNNLDVVQVTASTEILEDLEGFRVSITIPVEGSEYKLDAGFQATAEAAAAAANEWAKLIDVSGVVDLSESFINQKFFKEVVLTILADYNESLATAEAAYDEFAEILVVLNYVNEYPEKVATSEQGEYTTDTSVAAKVDEDNWKALLYDEVIAITKSAKTDAENPVPAMFYLDFGLLGDYVFVIDDAVYANEVALEGEYPIILRDNGDGTFTPVYNYTVYTYLWKAFNLARTAQDVRIDRDNTVEMDEVLGNVRDYFFDELDADVNYYELAVAMKVWVEKYLVEIPTDLFDLAPFKTVKEEKVLADADAVAFGDVKVTFADDKLAEESATAIVEINGAAVDAEPTEALDITAYADYNVALAAIAEYERLEAEKAAKLAALQAAVKAMFVPNAELDAITAARDLYEDVVDTYGEILTADEIEMVEACGITIGAAEEIRFAILHLYPYGDWTAALAGLQEDADVAAGNLAAINDLIAEYDELLNAAKERLAYLKAGNSIGAKGDEEEGTLDCMLVEDDDVKAQEQVVAVLTSWRRILVDATSVLMDMMTRAMLPVTPNMPADPDLLTSIDEEYLAERFAEYIDNEDLVEAMVALVTDAQQNGYFADQKTLVAMAEEADAALEAATEEFAENFKLDAKKSFADIEDLDDIIADLGAFLAGDEESDEDDQDYLNLNVANAYTDNLIDLFSQLFNERIMAAYYNSIELTREYCYALTGSYYAVDEQVLAFDEAHNTTWTEYATNQLKRAEALSAETFTSFAAAKAAVEEIWRSNLINYRWAVDAINTYEEDDVASYEELVYEELNGEEGYQPADDDDETEDDIPGILITGEIPQQP